MDEHMDLQLQETDRLVLRLGRRGVTVRSQEGATPSLHGVNLDQLDIDQSGGELSVVQRDRTRDGAPLTVHLPATWTIDLAAQVGTGPVGLHGLSGNLKVAVKNGAVTVDATRGALDVAVANGSIECAQVQGKLQASAANGKITVRESLITDGRIHAANGRVALQLQAGDGKVVVFSVHGRTILGLPEDGDFTARVRTMSRVINRLAAGQVSQQHGVSTIVQGEGTFNLLVHNVSGGVELVRYADFDPDKAVDDGDSERHGEWWFDMDFTEEFPRFMQGIRQFGRKFGRMGEEISRGMRDAWGANPFGWDGPPWGGPGRRHRPGGQGPWGPKRGGGPRPPRPPEDTEEVRMILDMLQSGKISAEEAEKLIGAMRGR